MASHVKVTCHFTAKLLTSDWLFDWCHKSGCVCFDRKSARSIIHEVVNILILCMVAMVIPIGNKHVALNA